MTRIVVTCLRQADTPAAFPAQALQSMRDTYEGPTAQAEGAVFPSVMAAFFAILALGSLCAAFLAVRGSRPRCATVATMALWCLVAVLMFLGAGERARGPWAGLAYGRNQTRARIGGCGRDVNGSNHTDVCGHPGRGIWVRNAPFGQCWCMPMLITPAQGSSCLA